MSESKHTQGRMVASCGGIFEADTRDAEGYPCNAIANMARERVPDDPPYHVGPYRIPPTESDANVHRFVACWNACEGEDDPESLIATLRESAAMSRRLFQAASDVGAKLEAERDAARAQRDALLDDLKRVASVTTAILECDGWSNALQGTDTGDPTEWIGPRLYTIHETAQRAIAAAKRVES